MTHASAFAVCSPTSSAPTRPGAWVTAMPSIVGERRARALERRLHHGHDVEDVRARGELGHDAAVARVDLVLRGDDVGAARARPSSTIAAAVSSHELSRPRTRISVARRAGAGSARRAGPSCSSSRNLLYASCASSHRRAAHRIAPRTSHTERVPRASFRAARSTEASASSIRPSRCSACATEQEPARRAMELERCVRVREGLRELTLLQRVVRLGQQRLGLVPSDRPPHRPAAGHPPRPPPHRPAAGHPPRPPHRPWPPRPPHRWRPRPRPRRRRRPSAGPPAPASESAAIFGADRRARQLDPHDQRDEGEDRGEREHQARAPVAGPTDDARALGLAPRRRAAGGPAARRGARTGAPAGRRRAPPTACISRVIRRGRIVTSSRWVSLGGVDTAPSASSPEASARSHARASRSSAAPTPRAPSAGAETAGARCGRRRGCECDGEDGSSAGIACGTLSSSRSNESSSSRSSSSSSAPASASSSSATRIRRSGAALGATAGGDAGAVTAGAAGGTGAAGSSSNSEGSIACAAATASSISRRLDGR